MQNWKYRWKEEQIKKVKTRTRKIKVEGIVIVDRI